MDVDSVTASSLGAQADKDEAQRSEKLRGVADHSKVQSEIAAAKLVAAKVPPLPHSPFPPVLCPSSSK